jgi:hypothetical protein
VGPVLVAAAVLGYLAGHHRPAPAPEEPARVAYQASFALEYPGTWQRTSAAPSIPGLQLSDPLLLAPGGDAGRAGLLSGQAAAGGAAPVPAAMVAAMQGLPRTEIVDLQNVQAYAYKGLRLAGFARALDLYVIPASSGPSTVLACYAATPGSSDLTQCEHIAAKLTPVGQARYDLGPQPEYSGRLGAAIAALDSGRLVLRHQLGVKQRPAALARVATVLAGHMATAAAAIHTLPAPATAQPAQATLVASIDRAAAAYRSLAAAAPSVEIAAAQREVDSAEGAIDISLENFALLGYKHS